MIKKEKRRRDRREGGTREPFLDATLLKEAGKPYVVFKHNAKLFFVLTVLFCASFTTGSFVFICPKQPKYFTAKNVSCSV